VVSLPSDRNGDPARRLCTLFGYVVDVVDEWLTDQEVLLVRYQDHVGAATPTQDDALVVV
jgi:hypothetical protein